MVTVTFFFKRGEGDRGNATEFFPTIVRQLVTKLPGLEISVRAAFSNDFDVGKKSLRVQFEELLLQPLSDLVKSNSFLQVIPITVVMVIDALDECNTDDDIQVILLLLPKLQKLNTIRVIIFLTSRPELPIGLGFSKMSNDQYQNLVLHEMPEEMASHDISLFLKDRLWKIQDKKDVPRDWPGEDVIRALVAMSVPLFISAATVCRYVESRLDPVEGLADLIKDQAKYSTRMDKTYLPILVRFLDGYEEIDKDQILQYYQQIIGTMILLAASFSVNTLSRFLRLQERLVSNLLNSFRSVLRLPSSRDQPVQILHQSFPDFLLGTTSGFCIDRCQTHKNIAFHCLQIMRNKLKKNICDLKGYGTKRIEISERLITQNLQPELQYSCRYWVHHLKNCMNEKDITQEALSFLYEHFLHWVEAMGILGLASEMVTIINTLQTITQVSLRHIAYYSMGTIHDSYTRSISIERR